MPTGISDDHVRPDLPLNPIFPAPSPLCFRYLSRPSVKKSSWAVAVHLASQATKI